MPSAVSRSTQRPRVQSGGYTVKPGDTLSTVAAKLLGDARRWPELYQLNRSIIGSNPNRLQAGMVLRIPGAQPLPAASEPQQPAGLGNDRYVPARQRSARTWDQQTAKEYGTFVADHTQRLKVQGVEIDCADLASKLLKDFSDTNGLQNPLQEKGSWHVFTAKRRGGLPNVEGPNYVYTGVSADSLAKGYTKRVNDANGNGLAGADRNGKVDVADLRPGDILFYDWEHDGKVNHTVNVLDVGQDGSVTIAFGTYNNLGTTKPVQWQHLDLQPIHVETLKPGTSEYAKYLGSWNDLWGVRRFSWMPDKTGDA